MDGSVLEGKKSSFKMLGLYLSSKMDWGSYIFSIPKTTTNKIEAVIFFMKFLSPEVVFYHCKSSMWPCMEYCCHVWAAAPSCYLEMLDKLQKQICRTVISSLTVSLEPQGHCQSVASLSLFYRYYSVRCSSELAQLVSLPYSLWSSTIYFHRLHFSVTILYVNSIELADTFYQYVLSKHISCIL